MAGSPLGPGSGVMKGATVGVTRIVMGVSAPRVAASSGARSARVPAVSGISVPPRGKVVTSWFMIPHSVIEPSSWLKAEAEMVRPMPYGWPSGVVAARAGGAPGTSMVEGSSGAPLGGWHCSGPVPTELEKSASALKSMASAPSVMAVNGASRCAWTASPTEPAIEISPSAVCMASAMGESAGPTPSGSPSLVAKPSATRDLIWGPAKEFTRVPTRNVSLSQTPEMNW